MIQQQLFQKMDVKRLIRIVITAAGMIGSALYLTVGASAADLASPVGDQYAARAIIAKHSGKCLDVPGGDFSDGIQIQQFTCHGGPNQRWILPGIAPGYDFHLIQTRGKVLDVRAKSRDNGAAVQLYTYNGGGNQLWYLVPFGLGDYYLIVSKESGKCLDIRGASRADHALLQQSLCHGGDNQLFRLAFQ